MASHSIPKAPDIPKNDRAPDDRLDQIVDTVRQAWSHTVQATVTPSVCAQMASQLIDHILNGIYTPRESLSGVLASRTRHIPYIADDVHDSRQQGRISLKDAAQTRDMTSVVCLI